MDLLESAEIAKLGLSRRYSTNFGGTHTGRRSEDHNVDSSTAQHRHANRAS